MKERRDRKEMKADQQRHYEGLEELPVSRKAKERFRRPAYQARGMIQSGELRGSDPVPADILEEDNKSVFEYLAEKYGIGEDDTDGRSGKN